MKGRYSGRHMTIYCTTLPKASSIASWYNKVKSLSKEARYRIKIIDWHNSHGKNISITSRHFGYTRKTIRKWIERFKEKGIIGLEEKSRKPHNVRKSKMPIEFIHETINLRKKYPKWSKYKLAKMLERKDNIIISPSSVGRILKRNNMIDKKVSRKKRKSSCNPKNRFPKGLVISKPGDLIQIDTKYIMLTGGKKLYQFTAIDVLTKKRFLDVYPSKSSFNGLKFLKDCLEYFPFEIKAIQTDNGCEFLKHFEKHCKENNITQYFIHPRTPKENTYVERSHRSDKNEFYLLGNVCSDIHIMRKKIKEWQHIWNYIRPHQALNYLTPDKYLEEFNKKGRISTKKTIVLQT